MARESHVQVKTQVLTKTKAFKLFKRFWFLFTYRTSKSRLDASFDKNTSFNFNIQSLVEMS